MVPAFLPTLLVGALLILVPTTLIVSAVGRNLMGVLGTFIVWAVYYAATYEYQVGMDRSFLPNALGLSAATALLFILSVSIGRVERSSNAPAPYQTASAATVRGPLETAALVFGILSGIASMLTLLLEFSRG